MCSAVRASNRPARPEKGPLPASSERCVFKRIARASGASEKANPLGQGCGNRSGWACDEFYTYPHPTPTGVPSWQVALLGYALVGAGCGNIVPVLFSAVGRQSAMPENVAVPAITTLGYAGILAGPAGIGFVAHMTSLPTAFLILAAMLIAVALSNRSL